MFTPLSPHSVAVVDQYYKQYHDLHDTTLVHFCREDILAYQESLEDHLDNMRAALRYCMHESTTEAAADAVHLATMLLAYAEVLTDFTRAKELR